MGYFLMILGVIILIICIFALISLFSGNMTNVYYFLLVFIIVGSIIGTMIVSKK